MMESNLPVIPQTEVNIRDYVDILRRRKAIMLQTFVVVLAVGIITTLMAKPVYETSAKMLISQSPRTVSLVQTDNPLSALLAQGDSDSLPTQMELLQSAPFMSSVF